MNRWTPEQLDDLMKYGKCRRCGWPRRAVATWENGKIVALGLGCWMNCDPCRRACRECGQYEDYEMDDQSWICHACGAVSFAAVAA